MNSVIQIGSSPKVESLNASEESVKALLAKLRTLKTERETAVDLLELQLKDLQEEVRQKALPFDQQTEVIEAEIKKLMLDVSKSIRTQNGEVKYRKGFKKVTYDGKMLDVLCSSRDDVKLLLTPYRKESKVAPLVSVEVF